MSDNRNGLGDPLKSCQSCRVVWHTATNLVEPYKKGGYSYYYDFPHYGLEKVECPRCIKEGSKSEQLCA